MVSALQEILLFPKYLTKCHSAIRKLLALSQEVLYHHLPVSNNLVATDHEYQPKPVQPDIPWREQLCPATGDHEFSPSVPTEL